jgi:hypothetical protein
MTGQMHADKRVITSTTSIRNHVCWPCGLLTYQSVGGSCWRHGWLIGDREVCGKIPWGYPAVRPYSVLAKEKVAEFRAGYSRCS